MIRCVYNHPRSCRAVGYFGHNVMQPFHFTMSYYMACYYSGASSRLNQGLWTKISSLSIPQSFALSTWWDISLEWCLHCSGEIRILPSHSAGLTKRPFFFAQGCTSFWSVCAFLLQVNNRVVHTEFQLQEEPIKVSLVMESTLTKFVYFWHQEDIKNKGCFVIGVVKNCEAS